MKYFILPIALLLPVVTFAATPYDLLAPIGGTSSVNSLKDYLVLAFQTIIGIAGVLAVIMIVICGIRLMSTGSVSGKSEAKDCIWNALLGILLAIGSWMILNTINPLLLNNDIGLVPLAPAPAVTPGAPASDPLPTVSAFYYRFDSGGGIIKNSPPFDTAQICKTMQDKAVDEGIIISQTCFYIPKPSEPAPSGTEVATRNLLCGNASCIYDQPFGVNKPPCKTPGGSAGESCTNLAGLPNATIMFIKSLPTAPGKYILITGGTEFNLHKTHAAGQPIFDLRLSINDPLYNLLKALPEKPSFNGNKKYTYNGYVFTDEVNCGKCVRHWHVCKAGTNATVQCNP